MEKRREYNKDIFIGLIYFNKASDSITRNYMLQAVRSQRVPQNHINLINEMYDELCVARDTKGPYFPLPPYLVQ